MQLGGPRLSRRIRFWPGRARGAIAEGAVAGHLLHDLGMRTIFERGLPTIVAGHVPVLWQPPLPRGEGATPRYATRQR